MNGALFLGIDVDPARIERRVLNGYCDRLALGLDEALDILDDAREQKRAVSVGLVGNCAEVLPEIVRRGIKVDAVTDQTSAHDPVEWLCPGWTFARRSSGTAPRRSGVLRHNSRCESMAEHVEAMLDFKRAGAVTFDYGNNIRKMAFDAGCKDAFEIPGFVPEYIRPLFCEGKGPFRWVALSGDASDIPKTGRPRARTFPDDKTLNRWLRLARDRVQFQGLPARICWLGYGERAEMGEAINELVAARRSESADRDRPRPSRHRLGRFALPRDRRNERRHRTRSLTGRFSTRC